MFPSEDQVRVLHEKYAPDEQTLAMIYGHSVIVAEIAEDLLRVKSDIHLDARLVRIGSLLHDIGAYTLFVNGVRTKEDYILHGIRGAEILQAEGIDARLARIASHHTGVGLTKEHILTTKLPLPAEDFLAETTEEELVMYADKFHSKTPRFNSYEGYLKTSMKFGPDNAQKFEALAAKFGIPDLGRLSEKYHQPLV